MSGSSTPLSTPHRDGWRNEHIAEMAKDPACAAAIARLLTAVITGDVPQKAADFLSSSTLIILLKKDAATMEALKQAQGDAYLQPQRPIGMGTAITKLACNCALHLVKEAMGPAVGPAQFAVDTKGGCALLQWALQMAMEVKPKLAGASLDAINAYGDIERECIEAAIMANPYLQLLLPLYEILYKKGEGILWYYDEHGNFVMSTRQRRGVRQGCVLGLLLFTVAMVPVYSRLRQEAGEEGVVYAYSDDSYILAPKEEMANVLQKAPGIYEKVGLRLGYGPGKTELILPQGCRKDEFPLTLDDPEVPAPQVVEGFTSCLGVPRHFSNDPVFLHDAMQKMGGAHDRLLDLTEEIADEDPFAALRLLQTSGISKFGHVLSAVPPALARDFARNRDEAIAATLATIQQAPIAESSTHALPIGAGGAGLTSLESHAAGGYIGAFFRIAGPLQQRLTAMGGTTNREVAAALTNPVNCRSELRGGDPTPAVIHTGRTAQRRRTSTTRQHDLLSRGPSIISQRPSEHHRRRRPTNAAGLYSSPERRQICGITDQKDAGMAEFLYTSQQNTS